MKEVSDGFDILVAVVALLFILTVGIWSIASVPEQHGCPG